MGCCLCAARKKCIDDYARLDDLQSPRCAEPLDPLLVSRFVGLDVEKVTMSDHLTRVLLGEDVAELVTYQATQSEAYAILNAAVDIQEAEGREMTLHEALQFITGISRGIEAMGE